MPSSESNGAGDIKMSVEGCIVSDMRSLKIRVMELVAGLVAYGLIIAVTLFQLRGRVRS